MNNKFLFTAALILLAVCIVLFFLKAIWNFTDNRSDEIYKQGLEFYKKGDYQNAYYNFKKISFLSPNSAPALYRQATCAWELKDNKTAIKKYIKFAKMYKNTNLVPEALWRLALLYDNSGNVTKSKKYLLRLVEKYPESDFAKAAAYKLGVIYFNSGDFEKAKKYFIEYIEYAPLGRYSIEVFNKLSEFNNLSNADKMYIAEALYINERYLDSINVLKYLPFKDAWFLLSKNYYKLSDFANFEEILLKGISIKSSLEDSIFQIKEEDLYEVMELYVNKAAYSKGAAYNLVLNSKDTKYYPLSLFLFSKYIDFDSKLLNYKKIYTVYPNSITAPDSVWQVFWYYYQKRDFENAMKLSKTYLDNHNEDKIKPKILFWSAKIYLKTGNKKLAKTLLQNIVRNYPYSYYAFRANGVLKKSKSPWKISSVKEIKDKFSLDKPPFNLDTKENRLLSSFVSLGDYEIIGNFKLDDEFLNSWLAAKNGRKTYSVFLARKAIKNADTAQLSTQKYKFAYPLYYREIVNEYAAKYKINPYLMLSLIREESFFDNTAVSSTGALGLMQLMPETAALMDNNFIGREALFEPEYNISLGVKYFAHLMKIFNGNEALCVLAYNSGPGSVQRWLKNMQINGDSKDFDEFVENVPYSETANYIKKVYATYWAYMRIYH